MKSMKQTIRLFCLAVVFHPVVGEGNDDEATNPSCTVVFDARSDNSTSSMPMVSPPAELVGLWEEGSYCARTGYEPLPLTMEMDNDGVHDFWPVDSESPTLEITGTASDTVAGWHCIDVGVGYWWSRTQDSDEVRCNLFRVEHIAQDTTTTSEEENNDDTTVLVSFTNVAYGGEAAGSACPTTPDANNPSLASYLPLQQASFTKRMDARDAAKFRTCTVPADSTDRAQPSCNSLLSPPTTGALAPYAASLRKTESWFLQNALDLPVLNPDTCLAYGEDADQPCIMTAPPIPAEPPTPITTHAIFVLLLVCVATGALCGCIRECNKCNSKGESIPVTLRVSPQSTQQHPDEKK